ncbi:odorant receptor 4-like [Ceratina calcarata]|uniref:Odorant receptor n=1 Tax=Ceratina calcarata TaxID=156304 RepID=A0AAJ7S193_9HYME|nr:odorant receptor 4-like [Ceratina calcarata]
MRNMSVRTNLDSNSDYSLQLNRWLLKPIGVWPSSSTASRHEKIISIIMNIVCYSSVMFAMIPCMLRMVLEEESFYMKLKSLGPVSHWTVSVVNYSTLLLRRNDIRYFVEHMRTDWRRITREKDQEIMMKNAKFGRYVITFCAAFMQGSILGFCFVTAMTTQAVQVGNETRILYVLPCAVYEKLLNVNENPTNEIVLFAQIWAAVIATSSTVGIFSLSAVLAAHARGQLRVLTEWITEFVNKSRSDKTGPLREIGMIVEHHLRALNFISYTEEAMNKIYLLELFRCTMIMCVIEFWILTEWDDKNIQNLTTYFMMYLSICFNIFIICYIGEILTEECRKVGEVVYMTNWYYLPDNHILDLIMIIARSSVVVQITAGKIFHMSIYTFGDVLKTGFAYLNLLRNMT